MKARYQNTVFTILFALTFSCICKSQEKITLAIDNFIEEPYRANIYQKGERILVRHSLGISSTIVFNLTKSISLSTGFGYQYYTYGYNWYYPTKPYHDLSPMVITSWNYRHDLIIPIKSHYLFFIKRIPFNFILGYEAHIRIRKWSQNDGFTSLSQASAYTLEIGPAFPNSKILNAAHLKAGFANFAKAFLGISLTKDFLFK